MCFLCSISWSFFFLNTGLLKIILFIFAFQSSFDLFFLIVSTIIFLFFILFIYLKTCVFHLTLIVTDVEIYLYAAEWCLWNGLCRLV